MRYVVDMLDEKETEDDFEDEDERLRMGRGEAIGGE